MINTKTHKECAASDCNVVFKMYKTTDKYCSYDCKKTHLKTQKKTHAIPKMGKKLAALMPKYYKIRAEFMNELESPICPVYPTKYVSDVHHKKGRSPTAFADKWAEQNNIPLLIDKRFFLGVSRSGHNYIEENPEWAKSVGFSIDRLS